MSLVNYYNRENGIIMDVQITQKTRFLFRIMFLFIQEKSNRDQAALILRNFFYPLQKSIIYHFTYFLAVNRARELTA